MKSLRSAVWNRQSVMLISRNYMQNSKLDGMCWYWLDRFVACQVPYMDIMKHLSDKKLDIVVDATNDLLVNVLQYHPFLIKPNNHELGEIFGWN